MERVRYSNEWRAGQTIGYSAAAMGIFMVSKKRWNYHSNYAAPSTKHRYGPTLRRHHTAFGRFHRYFKRQFTRLRLLTTPECKKRSGNTTSLQIHGRTRRFSRTIVDARRFHTRRQFDFAWLAAISTKTYLYNSTYNRWRKLQQCRCRKQQVGAVLFTATNLFICAAMGLCQPTIGTPFGLNH